MNVCAALVVPGACRPNCKMPGNANTGQYEVLAVMGMVREKVEFASLTMTEAANVPMLVELNPMVAVQDAWGATEAQFPALAAINAAFGPVKLAEKPKVVVPVLVMVNGTDAWVLLLGSGALGKLLAREIDDDPTVNEGPEPTPVPVNNRYWYGC